MTSHEPTECPACAAGLWVPNCTWTAECPDPAPTYLDPVRDEISRLRAELALVNDTLRLRTESHGRLVRDRLACPHCSTLPIEETPSE